MSAGPGWYPDPGGQPYLYRYWDGAAWTAATSSSPTSPPPGAGFPPSQPTGPTAYASGKRKSAVGWFIAGGALLVVIVVVIVLVVRAFGGGGIGPGGPTPVVPSAADTCPEAVRPTATGTPQVGDRVTSGRLSYPRLPSPFENPDWDDRVPFGRDVQKQDATVEADSAGRPTWVAGVIIARLLAGDGFYGPEQGAKAVAACVVAKFYGDSPVERQDKRNEALTVAGHQAWIIESHLSFRLPDIKTTGETMIVVVVDTKDGEAGLFYGSIPDTSPQFSKPIRDCLAGLQVAG